MPLEFFATGIDLSLNHAGVVRLNTAGEIDSFKYVTDKKTKAIEPNGIYLDIPKCADSKEREMLRLNWWRKILTASHISQRYAEYFGIEDYSFNSIGKVHQIAELGGIARIEILRKGVGLRLHDPLSVKMFATGRGNATGAEVARAVNLGHAWRGVDDELALEDLSAAYTVARMVWTEVMLREGMLPVDILPEHQSRVFTRITKANPLPILQRDFIYLKREAA